MIISALQLGKIDMSVEIIKTLNGCPPLIRAINLRALIISISSVKEEILRAIGSLISEWVSKKNTGMGREEELRLMTAIMKVHGNIDWYDPNNEGNWCTEPEINTCTWCGEVCACLPLLTSDSTCNHVETTYKYSTVQYIFMQIALIFKLFNLS